MQLRDLPVCLLALALLGPVACKDSSKSDAKPAAEKSSKSDKSSADDDDDDAPKKKKKHAKKGDGDDDGRDEAKKNEKKKADEKKGDDDDSNADDTKAAEQPASHGYRASLERARAAMGKKDYKTAIAAYDDACAARDDDALALGERGYAKVLDKQYQAGLKDCDGALAKTDDPKLLGPIWFNIGLAKEGLGDKKGALAAYKTSNELRPTKAAQSKITALGEKLVVVVPACPAKVDAKKVAGKSFKGWLAIFQDWVKKDGVYAPDTPPKNDAAAKKLLCGAAGCEGAGPWIAQFGGPEASVGVGVIGLVSPNADGTLTVWDDVGSAEMGARCFYRDDVKIMGGSPLRVHVVDEPQEPAFETEKGIECTPGTDGCLNACLPIEWTESDLFFDLAGKTRVLKVTESGKQDAQGKHKPTISCAVDGDDVHVKGGACDQRIKVK